MDASLAAIGAILTQKGQNKLEKMIGAYSYKMKNAQKNYSVIDK